MFKLDICCVQNILLCRPAIEKLQSCSMKAITVSSCESEQ